MSLLSSLSNLLVSKSQPQHYWAWTGEDFIPLGECLCVCDATDVALDTIKTPILGLFNQEQMAKFVKKASAELNHGLVPA